MTSGFALGCVTSERHVLLRGDSVFDVVEEYKNCTVQILRNSETGEESIGWWENASPPMIAKSVEVEDNE